jgi:hypothetical protein
VATVNDIDTKSAVRKFLERRSVVDKENQTSDSADETTAILESVALSFLLYPQAALSFVLQAKNVLQQVVSTDRDILAYFLKALEDVENPDEPITDTSDLVSAQAALVEVDRIGRVSSDVQAYGRYTKAISTFLDQRLATSLKRRNKNEFERTGNEAKQDLFRVLSVFDPTHNLVITKLEQLLSSVDNFRSVSLTKVVSTRTVSRVRSSLNQVIIGIQKQQLSKTATAIELLSGAAALSSVSNSRDIYDPTVDTGNTPTGRDISISSETTSALARGTAATTDLSALGTPWTFVSEVDGTNYSVTLPVSGASGRSYVKAASGSPTFNIPVGSNVLYVQFDGITPPTTEAAMVRAVTIPSGGSVSISGVLTALNDGSTGLINGTAVQLGATGRIILYGSSSVTKITIHTVGRGTFDIDGNFIPATGSVHKVLGFSDEQVSGDPDLFTPAELVDLLAPYVPSISASVNDSGEAVIETVSTELLASLTFSGPVAAAFGFSGNFIPDPSFLELIEDGVAIDPTSVGIFIGSMVSVSDIQSISTRNLFSPVTSIEETHLRFDSGIDLPRCEESHVRILAPIVFGVQTLFDNIRVFQGSFDQDSRNLQRVLSPILSKPTLAQINDAKRILQEILGNVDDLLTQLAATVVRPDRSEFDSVAKRISASLEERGLDKALELLQGCQFSDFFTTSSDGASKGTRFLKASEEVGRNEFAQQPAEQDQNDVEPLGTTPDSNLLPGEELMEDEEQI